MKTDRFNSMINSFGKDFEYAKLGFCKLDSLQYIIDSGKADLRYSRLIKDIDLLIELCSLLRSGQAEIHINDMSVIDEWMYCHLVQNIQG